MFKKIIFIVILSIFVASCGGTFDAVKKGLTGAKSEAADEFLVKKKDPLILPPDYENLPTPEERNAASEEFSIFQKSLENLEEEDSSKSNSVEDSILKKIQSK